MLRVARCTAMLTLATAALVMPAAAAEYAFMPPAGWELRQPPRGLLGFWVHTGDVDFRQNMIVGRERTNLSAAAYDAHQVQMLSNTLPGFILGADQPTIGCAGRPAHYLSYGSIINGRKIIYENLTTIIGGYAWFVIYTRAANQPSLPEARAALTTLCGEVAPRVQYVPRPAPTTPEVDATPSPMPTYAPVPADVQPTGTPYPTPAPTVTPATFR